MQDLGRESTECSMNITLTESEAGKRKRSFEDCKRLYFSQSNSQYEKHKPEKNRLMNLYVGEFPL